MPSAGATIVGQPTVGDAQPPHSPAVPPEPPPAAPPVPPPAVPALPPVVPPVEEPDDPPVGPVPPFPLLPPPWSSSSGRPPPSPPPPQAMKTNEHSKTQPSPVTPNETERRITKPPGDFPKKY